MIIRSALPSTLSATVAVAAGLLVLLPAPSFAHPHTDPAAQRPTTANGPLHESGTQVDLPAGAPALPDDISALSWLVADARTGDVLAAHSAHRKLPPASTLKTLFALTALPHLPERAAHQVSDADLAGIGEGSSLVGVVPGETYQVADLWRGVFLSSGNDAVRVLAEMNGGWDSTVDQMRDKARQLGALDTQVVSPDGYDEPGQVSSAFDLAVFGRAGLSSAEFVRYCSTRWAEFPSDEGSFGIQNTNRLLSGARGVEPYPGLIGIKNGYTSKAGNTLVAAARHDDRTLVVTVMNPQSGARNAVYEEARELLDWGFKAGDRAVPVDSLPQAPEDDPSPAGPFDSLQQSGEPEQSDEAEPTDETETADEPGQPDEADAADETDPANPSPSGSPSVSGAPSGSGAGSDGPGPAVKAVRSTPPHGAAGPGLASGSGPADRTADAGAGQRTDYLLPVIFTGSACLAGIALFFVRRAARRSQG